MNKARSKNTGSLRATDKRPKLLLAVQRSERRHFDFGSKDVDTFLNRMRSTVRRYAKDGIRKPKDVSKQLNLDGIHTACGGLWTPRLTTLLLAMLFEQPEAGQLSLWEREPEAVSANGARAPIKKRAFNGRAKVSLLAPIGKQPTPRKRKVVPVIRLVPAARISPAAASRMIAKIPSFSCRGNWGDLEKCHRHPCGPPKSPSS